MNRTGLIGKHVDWLCCAVPLISVPAKREVKAVITDGM